MEGNVILSGFLIGKGKEKVVLSVGSSCLVVLPITSRRG